MISLRPKSTDENKAQYERDSTITHPRSSKIQDPTGNIGDLDEERTRSRSDGSENQLSDHSRSSSTASDKSGQFKWFSNAISHSSDEEEDEEVKYRKGNHYRIPTKYF